MRIIDVQTGKIVRSAGQEILGEKELLLTQGVASSLNSLLKK
jgi:hypothetical protein